MAQRGDRHLTELAGLRAARLVLVTETEAGRSWAEARIKAVTGGEKLRANFMRQDHFEFRPQFKLLVAGNHRPSLGNVGEAMRRRLHLVPFNVTIPPERRDPRLVEKLLTERDGILAWALAGCAEWQRIGLAPPACVTAAAEEYFETEDIIGQWIAECCVCGSDRKALVLAPCSSPGRPGPKAVVSIPARRRCWARRCVPGGSATGPSTEAGAGSGLQFGPAGRIGNEPLHPRLMTPRSAGPSCAGSWRSGWSGSGPGSQADYLTTTEKVRYTIRPTRAVMQPQLSGEHA